MQAFCLARGDEDELRAGDMVIIGDGHRHGVEPHFHSAFKKSADNKAMDKSRARYFAAYDENSLAALRTATRGATTLDQVEIWNVFTRNPLALEKKDRKLFPGSSYGNFIGPVALLAYDKRWRIDSELKKKLLGPKGKDTSGWGPAEERGIII